MMKETRYLQMVNYIYFYLLFSIISWTIIFLSFGLLTLPTLKVLNISIYEVRNDEYNFYRGVIKKYYNNFKENIKILKFIPLSIYMIITIISFGYSSNIYVFIINIIILFIVIYVTNIIAITYDEDKNTLKKIYANFVLSTSLKNQADIAIYTFTYLVLAFFGYTNVFLMLLVLYQFILNKTLKEKKND